MEDRISIASPIMTMIQWIILLGYTWFHMENARKKSERKSSRKENKK